MKRYFSESLAATLGFLFALTASAAPAPDPAGAPYDPDANHLWNRLHRSIFIRTSGDGTQIGHDVLDPLLYGETKFLKEGTSHKVFVGLLDEFLATKADGGGPDPVKAAILQRDLWAVFDWAQRGNPYEGNTETPELTAPLAKAIRRLALSDEQIAALPDTYARAVASKTFPAEYDAEKPNRPYLPGDLLAADGPWVALKSGETFAARTHVVDFRGRTAFDVFINLPGGRAATLAYLTSVRDAKDPLVTIPPTRTDNRTLVRLNPNLPAPPRGTRFALIRRTMVIDRAGKIRSTPLVDEIQIRVVRETPRAAVRGTVDGRRSNDSGEYDVFELVRSRAKLFAGESGGLRAVSPEDTEPISPLFRAHLFDPLEFRNAGKVRDKPDLHVTLNSCADCHTGNSLESFQTLNRFPAYPNAKLPRLAAIDGNIFDADAAAVIAWKMKQEEWKALAALWEK